MKKGEIVSRNTVDRQVFSTFQTTNYTYVVGINPNILVFCQMAHNDFVVVNFTRGKARDIEKNSPGLEPPLSPHPEMTFEKTLWIDLYTYPSASRSSSFRGYRQL